MKKAPNGNDLLRIRPELAEQWHPTRNGQLKPEQVTVYSNQHVWWRCPQGHEWRATVAARAFHGTKCPYCTGRRVLPGFNDLLTLEPEIAHQWHDALNGDLTPDQVTVGSHKKSVVEMRAGPCVAGGSLFKNRPGSQRLPVLCEP